MIVMVIIMIKIIGRLIIMTVTANSKIIRTSKIYLYKYAYAISK